MLSISLGLLGLGAAANALLLPWEYGLQSPLNVHQSALSCPKDLPLSCTNSSEVPDTCCFEYPGGVLLQTQFWDAHPAVGPDDLFTLHGLWPDLCSGQYEQFCDPSMEIRDAEAVLKEAGETELLEKMNRIWKNFNGHDSLLWLHEFNKHGTCMSTLKPGCYGGDTAAAKNAGVVDFFRRSVEVFEGLPTYEWLADHGITPSETKTYTRDAIAKALEDHFGQPVYFKCNRMHELQEIWYFHHLQGSIAHGTFVPIPAMMGSECPISGIKFPPKDATSPTGTHPPGPHPTGPGNGVRGHITLEGQSGCIISNGHWYSSGTCATFTLSKAPFGGYNLDSSKGPCGLDGAGHLACGKNIQARQFSHDSEGYLVYGGADGWSSTEKAVGWKQVSVSPGSSGEYKFRLRWEK